MRSVRIVTINVWGDNREVDRRMRVLMPALAALEPHVVLLQEACQVPNGVQQAKRVAAVLNAQYRFLPVDDDGPRGAQGNALVTTLPISSTSHLALPSDRGDRRAALRCDLETPAGRWAVTTAHLTHELDAADVREKQAISLDAFAKADPGPLPSVLAGDLNCTPDSEVIRFLNGRVSLDGHSTYWRDAYQRRHPRSDGFTWSSRNGFSSRSAERDRRIDYILIGPRRDDGPGSVLHARVVLNLPDAEGVYPSDHFGVFAEISLAPRTAQAP